LAVAICAIAPFHVGRKALAAPGYLTALVAGGMIAFDQANGSIVYCLEHSYPAAPPTAHCSQIGTFPSYGLNGSFQINTTGGIVAYISNVTIGWIMVCGSGTSNTTWSCASDPAGAGSTDSPPGYLTALVTGGMLVLDQPTGEIDYCLETSFASAPPSLQCGEIGTFPQAELTGSFQINNGGAVNNGGIAAYITNTSNGHVVLCGGETNNTTKWSCTSIR